MAVGLSILMPVFNERTTVEAAIDDALSAELPLDRELVVVDDGSTDGTRELLRDGTWPDEVQIVFHDRNRGKGAAVRTALAHATGDFSAVLDADLEYRRLRPRRRCSSRSSRTSERRLREPRTGRPTPRTGSGT